MQTVKTVLREIIGLFVDDGSFAVAVLLWIGILWLITARFRVPVPGFILLTAGLCAVLIESLVRFSRRSAKNG